MPNDPYGDLIATPSTAAAPDPYKDLMGPSTAPLRASLTLAADQNTDEFAKARQIARRLGHPEEAVRALPEEAKRQDLIQQVETDTAQSPVLRNSFLQPDFAVLAKGDTPTLTKLEQSMRAFFGGGRPTKPTDSKKLYENTAQRFDLMSDKDMEGMKFGELKGWTGPQADLGSILTGLAKSLPQGLEIARQGASMQMGDTLEKLGLLTRSEDYKAQEMRKLQQARLAPEYTTPEFDSTTAKAAYGGLSSAVRQVPGVAASVLTRNPSIALGYIGATTEADAYGKYKERGATFGEATLGALLESGIEVGTEMLPMKFLAEKFGRMGLGDFVKGLMAKELPTEQIATLLQDAVDTAIANPNKSWGQYLAERPGAAYETLIATVVQASVMGGAHHAVTHMAEQQFREYEDAQHQHAILQGIMQTAAGSKLRELDPSTFNQFVQAAADGTEGAPKSMFIDGKQLAEVLNQAGVTEEQLAQALPSVLNQLTDAVNMGSAVEIPIGELATALPGTPLEQAILPHLRTSEDAPSQMEAQQAQASAQEFLQTSAQRVIDQAADGVKAAASAEAVRKTMFDQLMATGRMSEDVAQKNATLVREWYTVMSSMLGTTPEELYKAMPYTVQGAGQRGALTQERAAVTDTPEFKTWFGDSKVVDAEGKPLVVYHGTKGDFTEFASQRMGVGSTMFGDYEVERHGIFVTPIANLANDFATQGERNKQTGANVMPLYVSIKNPLDMNAGYTDEIFNKVEAWGNAKDLNGYRIARNLGDNWGDWALFDKDGGQDPEFLIGMLKDLGYDGVKYYEPKVGGEGAEGVAYVAFDPTQIKSATGNNGNFDGTDANILHQENVKNDSIQLGEDDGQPNTGDRRGRAEGSGPAPLEGAPAVPGYHGPDSRVVEVAERYALDNGIDLKRQAEYVKVDPERAARIASAYDAMPHAPQDPAVKEAYENLIRQTMAQYQALADAGYKFWFIDFNQPSNVEYAGSPWNAMRDMRANQQMGVFPTTDGFGSREEFNPDNNPLFADTGLMWPVGGIDGELKPVLANDLFRAVHDAFGHGLEGAGFRAQGEENAWQAHVRLFTGSAVGAITSETRGQNSWLNYGPHGQANQTAKVEDTVFADQKTGLMPEWTWTEGRAADQETDTSVQNDQRRMRQAVDLLILQSGENLNQETKADSNGRIDLKGVHFSRDSRNSVDGRYFGQGLKGVERERVAQSTDPRIKERVYFYIDEGKGVRPESGVGGAAHEADLVNLYELSADPLKLNRGGNVNLTETNILDAGFNGYYVRNAFNQQGAAVLLGAASRAVPVTPIANPTTKAPPLPVAPQVYKRGLMSKEANAMDIAAIQAVAPSAKLRSGTFQVDASELAAAREVATGQGIDLPDMPLQQPQAQGPRGTFNPATLTTVLNENADLSTFLHETGHFFHEALMQLASQPDAPREVKDLAAKALKSFGIKDIETWNAMDLEAKRPHYERFAETFELYLMTGKAPNVEIAGLFRTFRAWLTRVYKSLESFAQGKGITLDKDLKDVMDRMLATEAQIAEAEKVAGMVPELNATGEAIEQLQARSIRDLKWAVNARDKMIKALQKEAAVKRKEVEEEVTQEVDATPEMRAKKALDALRVDPDYAVALKTWNETRAEQLKQNQEALESELRAANPDVKGLAKGQLMAKNKRQIAASAELRTLEWEKQNPKPKRPVNMTDADVATVADSFGYESPEAMVQAIDAYGPRDVAIEGITDQRMLERYGDLTDPEAIAAAATEAVHNQARAKSLATELAAQREMLNKRDDTGKTNAKGQKVTVNALMEAAKQFAANVIGRRQISDLKKAANTHLQAERRAAKAWEAATAKGDTQAAVLAKQDQVLNNAAVRAAQDAQAEVKKTMEFFAKVTKGNSETVIEKGRDADVVNAARAILAVYGVAPFKGKNAFEYMSLVQANDPQMFAVLDASVKAAVASAKPIGQLTVDELTALRDEIDSMWHLAKASREYEVDGNRMDIAEAGEQIVARMVEKGIPDRIPGEGHAVTEGERAGRSLQFAGALLRRVEQWAEGMDGKFGGPFLRLVFQPVKEAANRYRTDRVAYREAFTKLVENLAPAIKPGLIEAPEIGYVFGKGKGAAGAAELTHAILHLGNESNKRKLLLGRQWATENPDGTLNTDRWDAFLKRMHDTGVLTKVHYDFAQGVWDLLEKMKPLAQKTHRDVFGRYFAEVTANTLSTPFGDYRGGYVPAQVDPEIVKDNEIRKLAEMENENMSYAFPSTNKGFTKSRTEYNRPLLLDIRALGQHMDKVLLFSHMEPAVRGVSKVLQEKGVAYSMNRIDPSAVSGMLTPWLNRSARQVVETPIVGDGRVSRVLSVVRARAGMSVMFANVSNTLQQVAGLALAGVKVKPSHLASAMATYTANPKKTSEAVAKASEFMANRMDDQISALNGTMDEILLNPSVYESAQAWTQKHAYFLQSALDNVIGPVVWTGAYNQAIEQGMDEKDAVRFADGTIRQTQGSTLPEDISRIETGPAYARVFTQFIGYFNMVANTNATALQNIADDVGLKKGAGKALGVVFMGLLAPAWIAEAIAVMFKGGPDDENKDGSYLADWLMAVFGMGTLKTVLAGVPFVGQFAMAGVNTWNDKPYDDRTNMSPAVSMLEGSVGAPRSVYKALVDNGSKQKAVRDVATAVSLMTGLPASAIARPLGYIAGMADHKINPTSAADEARGLVTGTASPQSKQ